MSEKDYQGRPGRDFVERRSRKNKDWVSFSITLIAVVGWAMAIMALLFVDFAKPASPTIWTRMFQQPVQSSWNRGLLLFILGILIFDFLLCMVGFILNITRHRRAGDRFNKGIISLWIISAVIIVIFLIVFWRYLF